MKQLAIWPAEVFWRDGIFDPKNLLNLDDRLSPNRLLRAELAKAGWDCHTPDYFFDRGVSPDAVLFSDMPARHLPELLGSWRPGIMKMVMLLECAVVSPRNWDRARHKEFDKVFTWADALVDGRKYFKVNFTQRIRPLQAEDGARDKFCVLIAANKRNNHHQELYSERVNTIRWFERNHPAKFDLYGIGWDRYAFGGPRLVRALNRITPLTRLIGGGFSSYKGTIEAKLPVLRRYKFSICYENARDVPGYVTEKIFDCLMAGTIPVYWGAPDIASLVPEACYVDRRAFATHEDLYAYLSGMGENELASRRKAIADFLSGPGVYQFSDRFFADTIVKAVSGE